MSCTFGVYVITIVGGLVCGLVFVWLFGVVLNYVFWFGVVDLLFAWLVFFGVVCLGVLGVGCFSCCVGCFSCLVVCLMLLLLLGFRCLGWLGVGVCWCCGLRVVGIAVLGLLIGWLGVCGLGFVFWLGLGGFVGVIFNYCWFGFGLVWLWCNLMSLRFLILLDVVVVGWVLMWLGFV